MSEESVNAVLKERYYQPGETSWRDICVRVFNYMYPVPSNDADIKLYEDMFGMLEKKEFIPNSPVLFNFGTEHPMGMACFGLDIEDDLKDIYKKLGWAARIFKLGGGCGFNFSNIRPKGDPVGTTNGVASGVVSFMKLFNASTEVIKQGGKRRGAAIAILNVSHPEIVDFINCKSVEGDLSNFNISVMLTDAFMKAVYNDEPFDLVYEGKVYTTCRARDLYSKICTAIWKNGEPGLLFYDRIDKDNPTPEIADIHVTNPCVVGETLILTDKGYLPIKDCVGKTTTIWNGFEWSIVTPKITGYDQDLMKVKFSNGSTLICTPYHKFKITNNIYEHEIEAQDLFDGDKLSRWYLPDDINPLSDIVKVSSVEKIERKDTVYCFNEPLNHTGIFNGVYTCNCGEQPIQCDPNTGAGEACNLGSINLVAMLTTDNSGNKYIDMHKLEKTVDNAVRFLDTVIDKTEFPLKGIEKMTKGNRKIGLGVMGFADMLIEMGLPYDPKNERTIAIIRDIMSVIKRVAERTSYDLAIDPGEYPHWRIGGDDPETQWRRNATLLSLAPTGTISMIAGVSSGIEPNFSFVYDRKNSTGTFREVHPKFDVELNFVAANLPNPVETCEILYETAIEHMHETGTIQDIPWLPDTFKAIFKTALDIKPEDHIGIQAEFQKYIDSSISKTINCPESTTIDDIKCYVDFAHNSGLKGLTFYRQNSRNEVVLNLKKDEEAKVPDTILDEHDGQGTKKRPEGLPGHTYKAKSGCGKLYITVNTKDGAPYEVFVKTSGNGGCEANINAIGRLISIALREGVSPSVITKQLGRVCCPVALKNGCSYKGKSCPDIIGKVLGLCGNPEPTIQATIEEFPAQPKGKVNIVTQPIGDWKQGTCPSCGSKVERSEGCLVCRNCGDSKC